MDQHNLPPGALSPNVPMDPEAAQQKYEALITSMNGIPLTRAQANAKLFGMGRNPEDWDKIIADGELDDTNHEQRAFIAVARGDERPLGEIYHEIRWASGKPIDGTVVNKTEEVVRRHNPLQPRRRSGHF